MTVFVELDTNKENISTMLVSVEICKITCDTLHLEDRSSHKILIPNVENKCAK